MPAPGSPVVTVAEERQAPRTACGPLALLQGGDIVTLLTSHQLGQVTWPHGEANA